MKNKIDIILTWIFMAPFLIFNKDIQPWYVKLLLIVLSPFSIVFFFFGALFFSVLSMPLSSSYEIYHNFKNAEDIAEITHSYIPPFDTVSAIHYQYGVDYTAVEKYYLRKPLTNQEIKKLTAECKKSTDWTETDSTYVYDDGENILNQETDHHYDFLKVIIPKKGKIMRMEYGDY